MYKQLNLTTKIILCMIIGVVIGILGGHKIIGIKLIGDLFLRLIQMAVIPLIFCAVIESIGSLKINQLGRLGIKTAIWFTITTVIASIIGFFAGWWFKPGVGLNLVMSIKSTKLLSDHHTSISQSIINFFPTNIFDSLQKGNTIQIIIFALFFGIALSQNNKNHQFDNFLSSIRQINELLINLINLIMRFAPVGVGALMAWVTATNGLKVILPLSKFLLLLGISSSIFLLILFIMIIIRARIPLHALIHGFSRIILIAITTTSSAASLSIEMADAENRLGVKKQISQLVLPLGMVLNSNGLAMYLSLACITMSQFYGLSISLLVMLKIITLSIVACLGTVIVPGGGLVALTIIVPTIGLPIESIGLLAGIDWISGIFRTVLNVVGDTTTAIMIASEENQLNREVYQQ